MKRKTIKCEIVPVSKEMELVRWNYANNELFDTYLRFNFKTGEIGCYVSVDPWMYSDQINIEIPALNADGANALMEWAKPRIENFINSHSSIYTEELHVLAQEISEVAKADYCEYEVHVECNYEKEFFNYSDVADQYGITADTTDKRLEEIREKFESDCQANERGSVKFFDSLEFLQSVRSSR